MLLDQSSDLIQRERDPRRPTGEDPVKTFSAERLGDLSGLYECAVPLSSNLCEVAHGRVRRVGYKVESMPGAMQRGDIHFNGRRILNEVSGELIVRVGGRERGHPLDSTPTDLEGVEYGSNRVSQRVTRIQAVRYRKGVERTVISDVQHGLSVIEIDFHAGGRDWRSPKQSCA